MFKVLKGCPDSSLFICQEVNRLEAHHILLPRTLGFCLCGPHTRLCSHRVEARQEGLRKLKINSLTELNDLCGHWSPGPLNS
jgi:hypothetical protein